MAAALKKIEETRSPGLDLALTASLLAVAVGLTAVLVKVALGLSDKFPYRVEIAFMVVALTVAVLAFKHLDTRSFGPGNRTTMLRVGLTALIAGFIFEEPAIANAWFIIVVTILGLILDGFDGTLARRSGQVTSFGARFDMETDAVLLMILAVLCWQFEKTGIWILAAGFMRYGFVGAAKLMPWMRRALPYSRRRQTICVLQTCGLLAVISPILPVPASSTIGLLTLGLLSASFATDIAWLVRQRNADQRAGHLSH